MRGRDHKACRLTISRCFRIRPCRAAWQPDCPNPALSACFFSAWLPVFYAPPSPAVRHSLRALLCIFRMREGKVARIIQRAHRRHFSSLHIWRCTRLPVLRPVRTHPLLHGRWSRCPSICRRNQPASGTATTSPSGHRLSILSGIEKTICSLRPSALPALSTTFPH
jgi:hypothetical protein